ncbi:hypothetical protein ACGFZP_04415 [Kitasatospora sp. NPDC048239]|uniref:hypothetical protein n=1 Tax=Kitasatospora sp. NPDC048239 TaxID=3364046 RepID=UPI00371ADDC5
MADSSSPRRFREYELVDFLAVVMSKSGYRDIAVDASAGQGRRVDLLAKFDDEFCIIEVKRVSPQTGIRVVDYVDQLTHYVALIEPELPAGANVRPVLAIPGVLSERVLDRLESAGIEVWDAAWIAKHAVAVGLREEASRFLADEHFDGIPDSQHVDLKRRLAEIPPGRGAWPAYQKICKDILELLFCPPLRSPIWERSDESGVNRKDIILPNYATDGFWEFMRREYHADYVVVDPKNYTQGIEKGEVLQIANYLSSHGAGLFAIIMARAGAKKSALHSIRDQWTQHRKMIVVLDEADILQMLADASFGNDPSELIRQKIEDFRLGMS